MLIELDWDNMTQAEKDFVNDIIQAGIFEIVRYDEVEKLVEDGTYKTKMDVFETYDNALKFLPHRYNDSCLVKNKDGTFRCRKINNLEVSEDNTKHTYMELRNDYSVACLKVLESIGLTDTLSFDSEGNVTEFKSSLDFFHPVRHIPPTNPTTDKNISPVEGYTFANLKSIQNVQRLKGSGGTSKCLCKYIAKIDEQNYCVIEVDGQGQLVSKATFLHNTNTTGNWPYLGVTNGGQTGIRTNYDPHKDRHISLL